VLSKAFLCCCERIVSVLSVFKPGYPIQVAARLIVASISLGCAPEEPPFVGGDGIDLLEVEGAELRRVYGSTGDGSLGLAVAGGVDVDGDTLPDTAFAAMQASPGGVSRAGQIYVVLGDGAISGALDTAVENPAILRINGETPYEYAGSELWMDDVTGDGVGDLLIGRQNHSSSLGGAAERQAAGALSIVAGGPHLRDLSSRLEAIELGRPDPAVPVLTLVGAEAGGRLGIWMRTGDVTGDGVADVVVGADQESSVAPRAGAVYVIAGGPLLGVTGSVDLAAIEGSVLTGNVAKLTPPASPAPENHHFGATCQIADLDGNGRGEVLAASALNRAGAILDVMGGTSAPGSGGSRRGSAFIVWDDNFPELPWPAGFTVAVGAGPGGHTALHGSAGNVSFGEELLGGLDWDADGSADLFAGDLTANAPGRPGTGSSHIIFEARRLKGVESEIAELAALDPPLRTTTIIGAGPGDISGDTAAQGDFSGDGIADLAVCSPHGSPLRRHSAGVVHVLHGQTGGWPRRIDLRALPDASEVHLVELYGAHGTFGNDRGDTLCYSAAAGDLDGDGLTDLITNEMVGNGLGAGSVNVGNLLLLGGPLLNRHPSEDLP
jgi:hypothetical protein